MKQTEVRETFTCDFCGKQVMRDLDHQQWRPPDGWFTINVSDAAEDMEDDYYACSMSCLAQLPFDFPIQA